MFPNSKVSFKVAFYIIIGGLFIIVAFVGYNYQNLDSGAYTVLYLLVIFIFLFGFVAGRNLALPIKQLLKRTDDIKKGDFKSRFYLKSKDELGELAVSLNSIAEELEKNKNKDEAVKKSDFLKTKTRILILEEIVNSLEKKVKNRSLELQQEIANSEKLKKELSMKEAELLSLKSKKRSTK